MREYVFNIQTQCSECNHIEWDMRLVKFPTQLNFEEDQDYIIEHLERFISNEYEDCECEGCGEITTEYVIGYSSNGNEYSVFNLSDSEGYYRAINLSLATTLAPRGEKIEIVKAKLSKIDGSGFFSPLNYEVFLIGEDHPLAKALLAQPEEQVKLDLRNFLLKNADPTFAGKSQAYYHNDYVNWLIETS